MHIVVWCGVCVIVFVFGVLTLRFEIRREMLVVRKAETK